MASIVQKNKTSNPDATASCTLNGVGAGNAIILLALSFTTGYSVTDTNGTPVEDVSKSGGIASYRVSIWSVLNANAGTHTFDLASGSTNSAIHAWEISGLATSSAFDKSSTDTGSGGTASSGSTATTSQADELIIGCVHAANTTFSAGSGYSDFQESTESTFFQSFASEAKIVAATSTYQADFPYAGSPNWSAAVATYKIAGGGGGKSPIFLARSLRFFPRR